MTAFLTVFITVFLAELGDKTQLATLLFASESSHPKWLVFSAASGALIASSALAVFLGGVLEQYFSALPLKLLAGIGFLVIGGLFIAEHFRAV